MQDEVPTTETVAETTTDLTAVTAPPPESLPPDNDAETESQAEREWFAKQNGSAPDPSKDVTTPEPADNAPTQDTPATPAPSLSPEELTLLRRYGLKDPTDIEAVATMPEKVRAKFVGNLTERAAFLDRLTKGQPPQQPAAPQPQPPEQKTVQQPALEPQWNALNEDIGEDVTNRFKTSVEAEIERRLNERLAPIQQFYQQQQIAALQQQFTQAFDAITLPPGVEKTAARPAVEQATIRLMQLDPTLSFEHATQTAAASIYANEFLAATKQARADQQHKNLRGSPTRTTAIPKTRPVEMSEEELEAEWLAKNAV